MHNGVIILLCDAHRCHGYFLLQAALVSCRRVDEIGDLHFMHRYVSEYQFMVITTWAFSQPGLGANLQSSILREQNQLLPWNWKDGVSLDWCSLADPLPNPGRLDYYL